MQTIDSQYVCFEALACAKVTTKGLSDVSILTGGIEAKGHSFFVDETSLEQFMQLVDGKTITAYLTHAGAIDDEGQPNDRLGEAIGMFSGFYRDGMQVRAKEFRFLDSFIKSRPQEHSTLVEMAKEFPEKLGISPVMFVRKNWVMDKGVELAAKAGVERPAGAVREIPSMRVLAVKSCDFVEEAAANYALFSRQVDDSTPDNHPTMPSETVLLSVHTAAIDGKNAEITALQAQHKDAIAALNTQHTAALAALQAQVNDGVAKLAQATEADKAKTAALAAVTNERDEAQKYDMRKAGAPALEVALQAHTQKLPAPAATAQGRWEQYATLCEVETDGKGIVLQHKETPLAKAFKEKFLR